MATSVTSEGGGAGASPCFLSGSWSVVDIRERPTAFKRRSLQMSLLEVQVRVRVWVWVAGGVPWRLWSAEALMPPPSSQTACDTKRSTWRQQGRGCWRLAAPARGPAPLTKLGQIRAADVGTNGKCRQKPRWGSKAEPVWLKHLQHFLSQSEGLRTA